MDIYGDIMKHNKTFTTPPVLGGFGEKKSNGGTQWFQQDRVYSSEFLAMAHPANVPGGSYRYLVSVNERDKNNR